MGMFVQKPSYMTSVKILSSVKSKIEGWEVSRWCLYVHVHHFSTLDLRGTIYILSYNAHVQVIHMYHIPTEGPDLEQCSTGFVMGKTTHKVWVILSLSL